MSSGKVRVSEWLLKSVDEYLSSELGRSKGFRSRRDVVEEALRRFLEEEGFWSSQRFKHINADGNLVIVYDRLLNRVATVSFRPPDRIYCDLCGEEDCIHVIYTLSIRKIAEKVASKGFRIPDRLASVDSIHTLRRTDS